MSRAIIVIVLMGLVFAGAMSMLPGCSSAPRYTAADIQPIYEAGEARSLVTDPPGIREHAAAAGYGVYLPWYADRNDHGLEVSAGYSLPQFETAYIDASDRLRSGANGRVIDSYYQTTRRTRIIERVR